MAFSILTILHAVAAVFAIIELGLTARIANVFDRDEWWGFYRDTPPFVTFMVFNSVWSLLVLLYVGVLAVFFVRIYHKIAGFTLNTITMLFWFAGSIALAVRTGGGIPAAATAFGFFLWAVFLALSVFDGLDVFGRRGHTTTTHPQV